MQLSHSFLELTVEWSSTLLISGGICSVTVGEVTVKYPPHLNMFLLLSVTGSFPLPTPPQVDFPSPVVDVLYVGPPETPCPDLDTLEELDPDLRRKIEKLCSRASTFGYDTQAHTHIHRLTITL